MNNNFSFLNKEPKYTQFCNACIEVESSLSVSYSTTAIMSRRALELAVKWLYSYDDELEIPYQDNLSSLIHNYQFKKLIDSNLFPLIKYIVKLGNKAVHSSVKITREQAVLSLRNLFEFISWIDYCYSEIYVSVDFDETLLSDSLDVKKSQKELKALFDKLGASDQKLDDAIKENEKLRKQNRERREDNTKSRDFNVNDLSEFKTRKLYIDLELELNGWIINQNCIEEVEVAGMPFGSGQGFVDYVLYGDDGNPLAVVEAKRTCKDPNIGKVQAQLYADCLETQYGVRPIIFYTNGFEYNMWDDSSYPSRVVSGVYSKSELEWLFFKRKNKISLADININPDITDRYYQHMAIKSVCDVLDRGERKALLVMATGSGKTRTAISIVDVLSNNHWIKNVLFLADRRKLVQQAKNNFSNLLPNLSLCNLLSNKDDPESRMVFSTYPTMMNAIDDVKNKQGEKLFTSGHFDLIIIDESHRSIYNKYMDIFQYFDAILLGLTATPKNDIDKNTYEVFDLENNVPTYSYELEQAVNDGYLVPFHTVETSLKFLEEGIHYDELTEEEKIEFENTFDDGVKDISSEEMNKFLFNKNTIDTVIQDLMTKGIRVDGGDKIGKTIIFAKNKKHAKFIIERFNILYPKYKGEMARPIYTDINYVDKTYDDFSTKEKLPQIAVSVDMLDTGVDIPEVVNLVFFKKIRSKTKFWQMIGRGTRLCRDLFGVGLDKDGFRIFDYCGNFEFFRAEQNTKEPKPVKSLTEMLFNIRVNIIKALQQTKYQTDEYIAYRNQLVSEVLGDIKAIDENKFNARLHLKYIHIYNREDAFSCLTDRDTGYMEEHLAQLIETKDTDELAKRFDLVMYIIELAELMGMQFNRFRTKVESSAKALEKKGTISKVFSQKDLLASVQTDEFWESADIFNYEIVRVALRDLMQFLEAETRKDYYTNFTDEILSVKEDGPFYQTEERKSYKLKVSQYLNKHKDDLVIQKIRMNKEITEKDVALLEEILWHDLGTKDDYIRDFGEEPLLRLIITIVGLDERAANELFSKFLQEETLNTNQMAFIKMIIDNIVKNGIFDKQLLSEFPYTKYGAITELFGDRMNTVMELIATIDGYNGKFNEVVG